MKKKLLFIIPLVLFALCTFFYFETQNSEELGVESLRAQHQEFLDNSPFKETINLSKKERKSRGLPPRKYFERQFELNMNPTLGYPEPYKVQKVQDKLMESRKNGATARVPGDAGDNKWIERGPDNVGGRTRVVFFDPNDGTNKRVFAGGVSGGLWVTSDITTNGGWTQVSGVPGNLNVSCFTIDPNDSNTWYIGTGEQYTFGQAVGNGVYKTTNGGTTWTNVPVQLSVNDPGDLTGSVEFLSGIYYINDIIARNNGGSTELYLAVGAHFYGPAVSPGNLLGTQSAGLYRSTDNGANWTRNETAVFRFMVSGFSFYFVPSDLEIAQDNTLWMGTSHTSGFGTTGGGLVFSSTNGTVWTQEYQVTNGLRVEIEPSATNADKIYVLAQTTTTPLMFVTTDAFATAPTAITLPIDPDGSVPNNDFTRGQSGYDLVLEADPTDDATVFIGGINIHRSTNSGTAWNTISHWHTFWSTAGSLVHADQHALTFRPGNSGQAVLGHDGGVSFASDLSTTGNNLTDIIPVDDDYNVTQFYHMGVAPTVFNANSFLGGTQDNGTPYFNGTSTTGPGSSTDVSGGDGAYSFFDQVATDYMITNYVYNNSITLWDFSVGAWRTVASNSNNDGDFINPQALDSNLDMLYSNGAQGATYQIFRYEGLTSLTMGVEATRTVLTNAILDAPATALQVSHHTTGSTTLLVGLENGSLLRITNANDGTIAWSELTVPFVGSISDIEFGASESDIFVTIHNYGVTSVWFTSNGGTSWTSKEGDLPDMPVKCILQNPLNTNEVIVGTELGVWRTANFGDASPNWVQSYNGMSDVKVTHLQLRDDNMVFASTYGRGIFNGQFAVGTLSVEDYSLSKNGIRIFPTINDGNFTVVAKSSLGNVNMKVYSITGQEVHNSKFDLSTSQNNFSLNVNSGIYFVNIKGGNFEGTQKVIIK